YDAAVRLKGRLTRRRFRADGGLNRKLSHSPHRLLPIPVAILFITIGLSRELFGLHDIKR
ncbi:MAG TPA: hypothetical protein VNO32_46805, partial [Candidatus Acidoferrum sp.]|nr:hypothetical protein [Candidatus Acidoferrum sp.]